MYIRMTLLRSDQGFGKEVAKFKGSDREALMQTLNIVEFDIVKVDEKTGMLIAKFANKADADAAFDAELDVRLAFVEHGGRGAWPIEGEVVYSFDK